MTGISWTDVTWNPTRGCSRVSEGCRHCYAETMAARIVRMGKGKPTAYDGLVRIKIIGEGTDFGATPTIEVARWTGKVAFDAVKLADPLRWKKPRRVFVNSMSDLFHEALTNEQIAAVFGVMAACPQHTFQVLTKRSKRMREWFAWIEKHADPLVSGCIAQCEDAAVDELSDADMPRLGHTAHQWPLPNIWIGVSVENQAAADERIPDLLATPAAVRFLSCEPLLGPVEISGRTGGSDYLGDRHDDAAGEDGIDWVIAGCESGAGARACDIDWLRSLRDQCGASGTAFFLKQAKYTAHEGGTYGVVTYGEGSREKPGLVVELPYLDGVQHAAFPEVKP